MPRIALCIVLLLLPVAAFAQRGVEISPFFAYRWDGDIDWADDVFDDNVETDGGEAYGLRVDIPINRSLQVELLASRQPSELVARGGLFQPDHRISDVDIDYYHVGLVWQWGLGQLQPFVVASAGIGRLVPDAPGLEAEERASASLGGGVKLFLGQHLGFRFEGRGFWTDLEGEGSFDSCGRHRDNCYRTDNALVQGEASVGLVLAF